MPSSTIVRRHKPTCGTDTKGNRVDWVNEENITKPTDKRIRLDRSDALVRKEGVVPAAAIFSAVPDQSIHSSTDPSSLISPSQSLPQGDPALAGTNAPKPPMPALQPQANGMMSGFQNPMPGAPNPLGAGTLAFGGARAPGMGKVSGTMEIPAQPFAPAPAPMTPKNGSFKKPMGRI